MRPISFAEFKRATHHRSVRFVWTSKSNEKKEFSTPTFYCNKDHRIKMLSMPKFMLDLNAKFFEDGDRFVAVSEFGTTEFLVVEGGGPH